MCRLSTGDPKDSCSVEVQITPSRRTATASRNLRLREGLTKMLTRSLKKICEDDGVKRLGAKEIGELQQAAQSAYHTCESYPCHEGSLC